MRLPTAGEHDCVCIPVKRQGDKWPIFFYWVYGPGTTQHCASTSIHIDSIIHPSLLVPLPPCKGSEERSSYWRVRMKHSLRPNKVADQPMMVASQDLRRIHDAFETSCRSRYNSCSTHIIHLENTPINPVLNMTMLHRDLQNKHEMLTVDQPILDIPDSLVQSSCFWTSDAEHVDLFVSSDFMKSASFNGGSKSSSASTVSQDFSTASASPGEQGVHFNTSVSGSGICLKWVADRSLRTGCMRASRTTMAISEPEYPSVFSARARKSLGPSWQGVLPMCSSNIRRRASTPGRGMYILFSNLCER